MTSEYVNFGIIALMCLLLSDAIPHLKFVGTVEPLEMTLQLDNILSNHAQGDSARSRATG